MRSCQIIEYGKPLEMREYPNPEPQGTEVLIKVTACGVCHTDVHVWQGFFDLGDGEQFTIASRGVELPFTMGHEVIGEVTALGPDASGVAVGDRRVVFPWIGCGECPACQRGWEVDCESPNPLGTRQHGGYSDHIIVPHARYLVAFGDVPEALACTYACSGLTVYSALKKVAHLQKDDTLLIIGAGGVGLNAVNIAPAETAAQVIVADIDPAKRQAALDAGAAHAVDNGSDNAVAELKKLSQGGARATIDFVGSPETAQFGFDALRRGGTQVIVGLWGGKFRFSLPFLPLQHRTLRGSYVGSLEELKELMALVMAGKIPPLPVATRPLDEATSVLEDLQQGGKIVGRVVLTP